MYDEYCDVAADRIQALIGGEKYRITPGMPGAGWLGAFQKHPVRWGHHIVVVKEGRVYDIYAGYEGMLIADYKEWFTDWEVLTFGF